jgi:MYXO-CTERM domain-containing protein
VHPPRRIDHVLAGALLVAGCLGAGPARAHFVLQSPAAAYEQSAYGDPQKAPPCGDDGSAVASGEVSVYKAGDVVTITIDETIFHPGHYRVALAMNDPAELPPEPPVTPNNTPCGTAPIADPPAFPVLADGIFLHTDPFDGPQSFDVVLPNDIACDDCTLQVIQFMSNHGLNDPGGCYYHHCANLVIEPASSESTTGTDGGETSTSASDPTATPTSGAASDSDGAPVTTGAPDGSGGATTGATTDATGATADGGSSNDDDGGCGCTGARPDAGAALVLLGVPWLRRRRRSARA